MELIAAVYEDWGIGRDGTQPITLAADRKFFREQTRGAMVIAGRRTVADFPGQRPLPGRENVVLTRGGGDFPGFTVCRSLEQALALAEQAPRAMVIGGGSVYRLLLPYCSRAYITKIHACPASDTWLTDLDREPDWALAETLQSGTEQGMDYEMLLYVRK